MRRNPCKKLGADGCHVTLPVLISAHFGAARSEEHTSELQSQSNLVCRLLLEKKKSYLRRLDAQAVGVAAWRLGAGRGRKEDPVNPTAGGMCPAQTRDPR